jgi:hypothetical protein
LKLDDPALEGTACETRDAHLLEAVRCQTTFMREGKVSLRDDLILLPLPIQVTRDGLE